MRIRLLGVKLKVSGYPVFSKSRIVPFNFWQPVRQSLQLYAKWIVTAVKSSNWATPIVTPLKMMGKYRISVKIIVQIWSHVCFSLPVGLTKLKISFIMQQVPLYSRESILRVHALNYPTPCTHPDNESSALTSTDARPDLYNQNILTLVLSTSRDTFHQFLNPDACDL